ncbi:hypothetical protein K457DRAFT_143190 [Linnemannia elongata AG-77]|uniref:Transmembrane protein n=1 Tax=Linnemannia elongata AG-77 TaxID=1314771 RepID=A0A197JCD3_9FUNG|nr:hypothetical protein K457DRAFT_143190 [Linnemannia elongata AG-77]
MFLPWSFFQLNLFFLILDILVATSFMAGIAHISRRTLHHTHSIRWIKQAGFLEMVTALWNSSIKVTRRPWLGLLATFAGGCTLTCILIGVKLCVVISTGETGLSHEVVESTQFIAVNSGITTLPIWSIPVSYNTSTKDALERALNSTAAIPRASPIKRYRPRLSDYEIACDQLNFNVIGNLSNDTLVLPNAGCATLTIHSPQTMDTNLTGSYVVQESKSRAKIVIPGTDKIKTLENGTVAETSLLVRLRVSDQDYCVTQDKTPDIILATRNGLSSTPLTVMNRCQLLSGEMVSLAVSGVRFSVSEPKNFHSIATSLFGTQDELVASMETSVDNGTLISQLADPFAQVLVMEVKIMGAEVLALMCIGSKQDGEDRIVCVYAVVHSTITKSRPWNPDIPQVFPKKGLSSVLSPGFVMMSLSHLPIVGMDKPIFAIPKILRSSSIAAAYFTNLGHNYMLDWEGSKLYIAYDTVEVIKGYEIPAGLFYLLIGVMVACFLFCAATEYWIEGQYKRSLYWHVAQALAPPQSKGSPQLHRFDIETLKFEGRRIVSTQVPQMLEEAPIYRHPVPDL